MFLKQSLKGNKSSNSEEDNIASREAKEETVPLFILILPPFFKAINTERSVCSALQIFDVSFAVSVEITDFSLLAAVTISNIKSKDKRMQGLHTAARPNSSCLQALTLNHTSLCLGYTPKANIHLHRHTLYLER